MTFFTCRDAHAHDYETVPDVRVGTGFETALPLYFLGAVGSASVRPIGWLSLGGEAALGSPRPRAGGGDPPIPFRVVGAARFYASIGRKGEASVGGTFGYAALTRDDLQVRGAGGSLTAGLHGFAGSVVSIDFEAGLLVLPVSERAHSFGGLLRMGFGVHFR